jgi:uncharacterized protein (DUF697 family)
VSFSKIFKAFREARDDVRDFPRLCVVGSGPEHARVIEVLTADAEGLAVGAGIVVAADPGELAPTSRAFGLWDTIVFVAAGTDAGRIAPLVRAARSESRDVIAVVRGHADEDWATRAGVHGDELARSYGPDPESGPSLENRIVRAAGNRGGALAAHLPAVRRAYCDHVILANAKQNGVIGVVVIIPGADMPAMTANQIRMVLQIAAAYGEEISLDRALEILSVIGTGFAFRTLARQTLPFVPGFGWAVKGAVGVSGTLALGRAAIAYFEAGAPLQVSRMKRVQNRLDRMVDKLPGSIQQHIPR